MNKKLHQHITQLLFLLRFFSVFECRACDPLTETALLGTWLRNGGERASRPVELKRPTPCKHIRTYGYFFFDFIVSFYFL